jgi:hypothetical protein
MECSTIPSGRSISRVRCSNEGCVSDFGSSSPGGIGLVITAIALSVVQTVAASPSIDDRQNGQTTKLASPIRESVNPNDVVVRAAVSNGGLSIVGTSDALSPRLLRTATPKIRRGATEWWGLGGLALTFGFCGVLYFVAKRFMPRSESGRMKVIGRVGLSPKHHVFLLQFGKRVILVGTGPQGAPSLLGELTDLSTAERDLPDGGNL